MMQEKKEATKPVRIKADLMRQIELLAIKESSNRGKLLTIAELIDELLREKLNEINGLDEKDDTLKQQYSYGSDQKNDQPKALKTDKPRLIRRSRKA